MKSIFCKFIKLTVLFFVLIGSGLTIYIQYSGNNFDPVSEIQKLKKQNRRDEALDFIQFCKENQIINTGIINLMEKDLEYTNTEKIKSFFWYGFTIGEVFDSYSGLGAISSDLCIYGDVRDLTVQSWKYFTEHKDFDKFVMFMSTVGIVLSSKPYIHICDSFLKNTIKYLKKIPSIIDKGIINKVILGKLSKNDSIKVLNLLKKTNGLFQKPFLVYPTLAI